MYVLGRELHMLSVSLTPKPLLIYFCRKAEISGVDVQ
jgi:hypothetical protein